MDLHRDSFLVCVREEGEARMQRWSLEQVAEFAGTLRAQDELAVEATGNTRWFCQQVAERVRRALPGVPVLGPTSCPIERRKKLWRRHVVVKLPPEGDPRPVAVAVAGLDTRRTRVTVDVDAYNLV